MKNGKPQVKGGYKVDGVPGTGAVSASTWPELSAPRRRLLPTGNAMDTLDIKGFGLLPYPCWMPAVHGVRPGQGPWPEGDRVPGEIDSDPKCWSCWRRFAPRRRWSWALPGSGNGRTKIVRSQWWRSYHLRRTTPATLMGHRFPRTILISYPGYVYGNHAQDLFRYGHGLHGCAAVTPGTIVNEAMGKTITDGMVRIGHPAALLNAI